MTYLYPFLTTQWLSEVTGANHSTISHWRSRGVPKCYQRNLNAAIIDLAYKMLNDCGVSLEKPQLPENPKRDRPSTAQWAKVRDIVTAQLQEEGHNTKELIDQSVAILGEQRYWKIYMQNPNCAERMAKHEAKEKPA